MIGYIDIKVNAARPDLPLPLVTAYAGSPSSFRVFNVPPKIGSWEIKSLTVSLDYPNGVTVRVPCTRIGPVWVATAPASDVAGTAVNGFVVYADGIDENAAPVRNYILGVGDVTILNRESSITPETVIYKGDRGDTPYIGQNGNWFVGQTDTGVHAQGPNGEPGEPGRDGDTPYVGQNGNWFVGQTDTGVHAQGPNGEPGRDGDTPYIGQNGNWFVGQTDTGVHAQGPKGDIPADYGTVSQNAANGAEHAERRGSGDVTWSNPHGISGEDVRLRNGNSPSVTDAIGQAFKDIEDKQDKLSDAKLANIDAVPQKRDNTDMYTEWTLGSGVVEVFWRDEDSAWFMRIDGGGGKYLITSVKDTLKLEYEDEFGRIFTATRQRILTTADVTNDLTNPPEGKAANAAAVARLLSGITAQDIADFLKYKGEVAVIDGATIEAYASGDVCLYGGYIEFYEDVPIGFKVEDGMPYDPYSPTDGFKKLIYLFGSDNKHLGQTITEVAEAATKSKLSAADADFKAAVEASNAGGLTDSAMAGVFATPAFKEQIEIGIETKTTDFAAEDGKRYTVASMPATLAVTLPSYTGDAANVAHIFEARFDGTALSADASVTFAGATATTMDTDCGTVKAGKVALMSAFWNGATWDVSWKNQG